MKTMTRRKWKDSHAKKFRKGLIVKAVDKLPYLGGQEICKIVITKDPYKQALKDMPVGDLKRERSPWKTKKEFIDGLGGNPEEIVWVLEFGYPDGD